MGADGEGNAVSFRYLAQQHAHAEIMPVRDVRPKLFDYTVYLPKELFLGWIRKVLVQVLDLAVHWTGVVAWNEFERERFTPRVDRFLVRDDLNRIVVAEAAHFFMHVGLRESRILHDKI